MNVPAFAVVGHPNKGKSSIVATLAEDDNIAIGPIPGTTRRAQRHRLVIDGEPQYELIDTPGFQRAGAVMAWLDDHAEGADTRARSVADFVEVHADDPRFSDEVELLRPVIAGAGILYVVDGAVPYGAEYELEMQILQWTGQPRMALINMIGTGNHVDAWREALGQYFSLVRVFDAVQADFDKRLTLLKGFAEIDEQWQPPIDNTLRALTAERERRRAQAAGEIASMLTEILGAQEFAPLEEDADPQPLRQQLTDRLLERNRRREQTCRDRVEKIYRHHHLERSEQAASPIAADLFERDGWELFGLSRTQMLLTGVVSGAVTGGGIDALVGGASLLAGTGIGAVVGGLSAWLGGEGLARVRVLGEPLGGRTLAVGPIRSGNFPWVLLVRAWLHHQLVAERNHARREAMEVAVTGDLHLADQVPEHLRRKLVRVFKSAAGGSLDGSERAALAALLEDLLARQPHAIDVLE